MRVSLHRIETLLFYLLILLLPTQLGKHFWPAFSFVEGIRVDYLSPTLHLTDIVTVLLFVCFLLRWKPKRISITQRALTPLLFYFIFSLFLLISILLSSSLENGLFHLIKFFEFSFVSFYLAHTVRTTRQMIVLAFCLSAGVIGESFLALVQYLLHSSVGGLAYWFGERTFTGSTPGIANASINGSLVLRPYGTFSHPNVLAGYLLLSLTLILVVSGLGRAQSMKVFFWITLLIGTSALILTMSRVAILLWFVVFSMFSLFTMNRSVWKRSRALLVGILCFLCATAFAFFSPVFFRFSQMSWMEESVVAREALFENALRLFVSHPFMGVGLGNFIPRSAEITQTFSLSTLMQPVHNIFFLVAVELGVFGLVFFLWFLLLSYRRLLHLVKQRRNALVFLPLILLSECLLIGLVDHYFLTIQQGQLLLAVVFGMVWMHLPPLENEKKK